MILTLSGRKGSGKSVLSKILLDRNFKKISFADKFKNIVANLFNWDLKDLYCPIKKEEILEKPVVWNSDVASRFCTLSKLKDVPCEYAELVSIRHALQFIGTDIIRKVQPDFHIKSVEELINKNTNYVLDDCRFPDELEFLEKQLNATCVYIVRPYYFDNYSNHASEISINRKDFNYVLLNDRSIQTLSKRFAKFVDNCFKISRKSNFKFVDNCFKISRKSNFKISREEFKELFSKNQGNTSSLAAFLGCSRDKVVWWANRFMVPISRNIYTCNDDAFYSCNSYSSYFAGLLSADGSIKSHLKYDKVLELSLTDRILVERFKKFINSNKPIYEVIKKNGELQYCIDICSPYMIDDMKLWNIEPRKSKYNKIPDCIKNNDELLCYWLVGLIDGDGSVYPTNNDSNIGVTILASKEVIEFIDKWLGIPERCLCKEKDIDNLWNLKYSGKYAVQLYRKIYKGIGLERKWNQFVPFLNKKWHH